MTKKRLELELETGGPAAGDHPASKMFAGAPKRKAQRTGAKTAQGKKGAITVSQAGIRAAYRALKRSDRDVIDYLKRLQGSRGSCKASIPGIAGACNISERQVQISTQRLIEAEMLERLGYDLGNPNRAERGTIYKVLI
ncbi:MAG TPA: hypothetical protein VF507_00705 [Pyrinomonadaceae bacterium]|jgi:hypothetical protein